MFTIKYFYILRLHSVTLNMLIRDNLKIIVDLLHSFSNLVILILYLKYPVYLIMGFSKCGHFWILNYTQWTKILDDRYNKQLKNIHYRLNIKHVP